MGVEVTVCVTTSPEIVVTTKLVTGGTEVVLDGVEVDVDVELEVVEVVLGVGVGVVVVEGVCAQENQ